MTFIFYFFFTIHFLRFPKNNGTQKKTVTTELFPQYISLPRIYFWRNWKEYQQKSYFPTSLYILPRLYILYPPTYISLSIFANPISLRPWINLIFMNNQFLPTGSSIDLFSCFFLNLSICQSPPVGRVMHTEQVLELFLFLEKKKNSSSSLCSSRMPFSLDWFPTLMERSHHELLLSWTYSQLCRHIITARKVEFLSHLILCTLPRIFTLISLKMYKNVEDII